MTQTNNFVFTTLKIIAWVIFVGLCVEAGGLIVNFAVTIYKPEFIQNWYQKLDLSQLHIRSRSAFFSLYSFILSISILKAILFYEVIKLISKIDLANPFSYFASGQILKISYYTFSIGIVSYIARQTADRFEPTVAITNNINHFWADTQAFILMAAVVYVIAAIFRKGVELQEENNLTV